MQIGEFKNDQAQGDDGLFVNGAQINIVTLQPGDATNFPKVGHTVRVHYTASLADSMQFDSSRARDQPIVFKLGSGTVLPGLEAGIKTMSRGQVAKIEVPPEAAYGINGYPPIIPPNAILFFEVELISFCNIEEEIDKS